MSERENTVDAVLLDRLAIHRAHGPADSLYGRCVVCGMTWGQQERARKLSLDRIEAMVRRAERDGGAR